MQGTPENMQENPHYPLGVKKEVQAFLSARVQLFLEAGISKDRLWVDPGIGFGKTLEDNLTLLSSLKSFSSIGGRLAIGTSRKKFLSQVLTPPEVDFSLREAGTLSSNLWAYTQGASVFRVHEVGAFKRALRTWQAVESSESCLYEERSDEVISKFRREL
jgi:dihydropteroate synthase